MNLEELRIEIDAVDDALTALLARRMALAARVAAIKRETGAPVHQPERETAILKRLSEKMEPEARPAIETIYEAIFRASRAYQEGLI
jgi:chorismate mutase